MYPKSEEEDEFWYPSDSYIWVDQGEIETPILYTEVNDPEIINIIYGPDGEELIYIYDKETFPFGFCSGE